MILVSYEMRQRRQHQRDAVHDTERHWRQNRERKTITAIPDHHALAPFRLEGTERCNSKTMISQRSRRPGKAEALVTVPVARMAVEAVACAEVLRIALPAASA